MSLGSSHDFFDSTFYERVIELGMQNLEFTSLSDPELVYLFIHDDPDIKKVRKPNTKKVYFHDLSYFMRYVLETSGSLRALHKEDVKRYFYRIKDYKDTTLRRKKAVIKQFLQYIYRKGAIPEDITSEIPGISIDKKQLVNRDFSTEEVEQLLYYFKHNDSFMYALLYTLVTTGMRIKELTNAKWNELIYDANHDAYILQIIGKGDTPREVRIFEEVLESIKKVRQLRGLSIDVDLTDNSAFLPKADGSHYNSDYLGTFFSTKIIKTTFPFVSHRKNKITPHTCRHFTAKYLSQQNIDLKSISEFLGHASVRTTEIYLRRQNLRENLATLKLGKTMFSVK
ncbi:integrase [Bacillus manliponensis]|uniref:Integrase n=2 Tax=Bacillus manliponensis TaxID=574376 RepID=A0A073K6M7_9BACI|nr:integrase [Bacillus manliponensis]